MWRGPGDQNISSCSATSPCSPATHALHALSTEAHSSAGGWDRASWEAAPSCVVCKGFVETLWLRGIVTDVGVPAGACDVSWSLPVCRELATLLFLFCYFLLW